MRPDEKLKIFKPPKGLRTRFVNILQDAARGAKRASILKAGRYFYRWETPLNQKACQTIEGTYVDKKCPFTGNVSIRGHILRGVVKSTAMKRTIVIRRDYLHYRPKYSRYEKRHKNLSVHCSPCFEVHVGDMVLVGQCRPLSKTVKFNVVKVIPRAISKKQFSKF
ncbi:MAG: putative 40S ribosomal protein S11 [Streblomastix strix]|uniref:Small ribosomal subunit protein uS17 n=1 Tax=Streblomastix strix TaxID=222440 RepID=A0A5J4WPC3_9EUKA|nr:MAG: putative 40S ribosomal protein S11 [Streblomastix strix]